MIFYFRVSHFYFFQQRLKYYFFYKQLVFSKHTLYILICRIWKNDWLYMYLSTSILYTADKRKWFCTFKLREVVLSKESSQKLLFIDIKYKRKPKKLKYILFFKILDSNLPCRKDAWIALKLFEHSEYLYNDNVSKILLLFVCR